MRLFVAVDLSDDLKSRVADLQQQLRRTLAHSASTARMTWVAADRFHLTLRFIGEIAEAPAASIVTALAMPFPESPFDLSLGGVGMFPTSGRPRVLWLGVTEGLDPLRRLALEAERRLSAAGLAAESRPLAPHLTLARFRDAGTMDDRVRLERLRAAPAGRCRVECVTVYQSRLSPKGPTYVAEARAPLVAGARP